MNKVYGEIHSFIKLTYAVGANGIASLREFQCVPTTYATEIKETFLKYTLNKYHVH